MRALGLFATLALLTVTGCRTVVVDQETSDTPPRPREEYVAATTTENDPYRRTFDSVPGEVPRRHRNIITINTDDIESRFRTAYEAKDRPRLAIYLNLQLSEEVREWRDTDRWRHEGGSKSADAAGEWTEQHRDESIRERDLAGDGAARRSPPEDWMFAFEDGSLLPYLRAGGQPVDRALILRLTAADSTGSVAAPRRVEIDALRGYADVLIEILVTRQQSAPIGYEFRATAREIETGRVLAVASSLRWSDEDPFDLVKFTGTHGADLEWDWDVPPVYLVSELLSYQLMRELSASWTQ